MKVYKQLCRKRIGRRFAAMMMTVMMPASLLTAQPAAAAATVVDTTLTVDERTEIHPAAKMLLGMNHDAAWSYNGALSEGTSAAERPEFVEMMRKYGIQARFSRGFFHTLNWKQTIGPIEKRSGNGYSQIYTFGLVEWIKAMQAITPDAAFSFTINVDDTPENLADMVRFLTLMPEDAEAIGSDGVNWPAMRIAYGIAEPVNVRCLELGNETDMRFLVDNGTSIQDYDPAGSVWYVETCRPIVQAIRQVNPHVPIGAVACSVPHGADWKAWNEPVIAQLGALVDYVIPHWYYGTSGNKWQAWDQDRLGTQLMAEINKLPEGSRPRVFPSEHAVYVNPSQASTANRINVTNLKGTLVTAEMINRYANEPEVDLAAYHAFMGSVSTPEKWGGNCWGMIRPYRDGNYVLSTVGEFYQMADSVTEGAVVSSALSGNDYVVPAKSSRELLTASAYVTEEGGLNLLLVNTNGSISHNVTLQASKAYRLERETVLTSPSAADENLPPDREDFVWNKTKIYTDATAFSTYQVPPQSAVALYLKPLNTAFAGPEKAWIKVGDQTAQGEALSVRAGQEVLVQCTLAENGPMNGAERLSCLVVRQGGNPNSLSQEDVSYYVQMDDVVRNRTGFTIVLPEAGSYQLLVGANGETEQIPLQCTEPENDTGEISWVYTNDGSGQIEYGVTFPEKLYGTDYTMEVHRASSGELVYSDAGIAQACMAGRFEIPQAMPSGDYVMTLNGRGIRCQKEFVFRKAGEIIRISRGPDVDGRLLAREDLTQPRNVTVELTNLKDATKNAMVILAAYNEENVLVTTAKSESVRLGRFDSGEEAAEVTLAMPAVPEDVAEVKLFVWDGQMLEALTKAYSVKESEEIS